MELSNNGKLDILQITLELFDEDKATRVFIKGL